MPNKLTHHPNGISSFGIPLVGSGPILTTGNVFFVDSGSDGRLDAADRGRDPDTPFATIDYAIGRCTADNGDFILVAAGHTESVTAAAGIVCDVAGITIIGLGNSNNRPTITFATSTLADLDITADDVRLSNLRFTLSVDSPVALIDIGAAQVQIDKCQFLGTASFQPDIWIDVDADADYCKLLENEFVDVTAGAAEAINISGTLVDLEIAYNRFYGDYSNACVYTTLNCSQLNIHHNNMTNLQTDDHCIELKTGTQTGVIAYNIVNNTSLADVAVRGAIDPGTCYCVENYGARADADNVSGVLNPTADS